MRMQHKMDELRHLVRDRQERLDKFREELGLREAPGGGEPVSRSSERVAELTRSRARWAAEYEEVNQTLAQFKQQSPAQLRQTIPIARPDPQLDKLLNDLSQQEQRLATLGADLGPEHPDVRRQEASLRQLNKQVEARIEGLMLGWETLANSRRELMDKMQQELEKALAKEFSQRDEEGGCSSFRPDGVATFGKVDAAQKLFATVLGCAGNHSVSAFRAHICARVPSVQRREVIRLGEPARRLQSP